MDPAAEKITGRKRTEILGKKCRDVCNSDFCRTECPVMIALESKDTVYDFESKVQCENGKIIPVRLNSAVLKNDNGEAVGGVVLFRDI